MVTGTAGEGGGMPPAGWAGHFRPLWLKLMITSDGLRGNCVIVWTLNKDSAAPGGQVNSLSTRVTK